MTRTIKRWISLLLVIVFCFQLMPVSALAADTAAGDPKALEEDLTDDTPEEQDPLNTSQRVANDEIAILYENEELREEFVKQFSLSNTNMMAVVYPHSVHYDDNGLWVEIDNRLKDDAVKYTVPAHEGLPTEEYISEEQGSGTKKMETPEKEGEKDIDYSEKAEVSDEVLRNIANSFSIALPKTLSEKNRIGITLNGYSLYFRPDGVSDSKAHIDEMEVPKGENNRKMAVNNQSSVTYPAVGDGIDLNYQLIGQELKERYILHSIENTPKEVSSTISAPDLFPKLHEDGSIEFADKSEKVIFCIPKPCLYDANGLNGNVSVSLYALNTGDFRLVYHPDLEWLGREDRAWPVVLDPTISTMLALSSFEDSYVTSASPTASYPSTINLIVGNAGTSGTCRAYLRMNDLPALKSSDVVVSAWLSFYAEVSSSMTQGITSQVFMVNKSSTVNYSAITWNNQPAHEDDALDQKINSNNLFGYNNFDITRAVRKWYGGMTNNGLVFMSTDEDTYAWYYYYAKENTGNNRYPQLTIVYTNTNGIEDYWDYTSMDVGRAGTIRVQDYSGNLIVSRTDMSYGGNLPGAPVQFHYNLATRGTNLGYGYGWRNNFTQTIESKTISSVNYYQWIDGDGTQKYFKKTDGVWQDESGLGYKLKITADATGTSDKYTITDKKNNKLIFDGYGRLTSVKDSSQNTIVIDYKANSSDNLRIATVTDPAGRKYCYTYSSGTTGDLTSVAFRGTGTTNLETVTYTYTDSQPTKVTYADGKSATYAWGTRRLNSARDVLMEDGTRDRVSVTRTSGTPTRTASLTYVSHGETISTLSFEYGDNTTKVTDALGRYVIYQFNNFGNTTAVYNSEGQALYGRYAQDSDEDNRANQLLGSSRLQDTVVGNKTYTLHVGSTNETIHLVTRENLLQNGDITNDISGTWTGANTTSDDKRVSKPNEAGETRGKLNKYALKIVGSPKKAKRFTQTVSVSGSAGDIFTFGGWAKCSTVSLSSQTKEGLSDYPRRAGIWLELYNGSTKVCAKYIPVNEDVHYWQFLSGSLKATGAYTKAKFHFRYENNANQAFFDGAQLFKESFEYVYKYDSDGNLTSVTDPVGNKTTYTYVDGTGDISKIKLPDGNEFNYSYNSKHLLTQSISALGVTTDYTYDSKGNSTSASIHPQSGGRAIQSNTSYTADKNMTASVTGGDRNTVTYTNNTEKSLVNSITDAKNNVTSYSYDVMRRRIQALAPNGGSVDSVYTDDLLTGVSHTNEIDSVTSEATSTDYGFTYGLANLPAAVKVGENWTLVNKTYNTGTWTLSQQAFGNSDWWKYTYDPGTDELLTRFSNSGTGYEYIYNTKGQVARILKKAVTIVDGEVTAGTLLSSENYLYDAFDRLVRIIYADGGNNLIADVRWTYDNNENITSVRVRVMENGTLRTQNYSYTYNDDKQPESTTYGNVTETLSYDAYGRTASKTVTNSGSTVLASAYAYRDIDTDFTTTQVHSLSSTYGSTTDSHSYTYDANGNILSDSDGTYTTAYEYDSLNQLTLEKNGAAGKAWAYTYDLGGNILTKTEYDYDPVTDQTSNPVTVNYVYGDTEWHDLLTSYNNQTITYDGIGNPLSYRGWTMIWQGGRQLAGMTDGTHTLSFDYNEGGLRTTKTIDGVARSYIWNSSQLLVDQGVDDTFYFHYNANGEMVSYTYKTASGETECFLVKNQQGDVEKVISADGTVLAAYTYDAWGNVLTSAGTLASVNPIRYRGYYFDSESGLYYLHSRYYDPQTGRFINADDAAMLGGDGDLQSYNLFAYCSNNPVSKVDDNGKLANCIVGLVIGGVVGGLSALIKGNDIAAGVTQGATSGFFSGLAVDVAVALAPVGIIAVGITAFAGGFLGNIAGEEAGSLISTGHYVNDVKPMLIRSAIAGGINVVAAGFSAGLKAPNATQEVTRDYVGPALDNIYDTSLAAEDAVSSFAAVHFSIHNEGFCSLINRSNSR